MYRGVGYRIVPPGTWVPTSKSHTPLVTGVQACRASGGAQKRPSVLHPPADEVPRTKIAVPETQRCHSTPGSRWEGLEAGEGDSISQPPRS